MDLKFEEMKVQPVLRSRLCSNATIPLFTLNGNPYAYFILTARYINGQYLVSRVLPRSRIPRVIDSWAQIFKSQNGISKSLIEMSKGQNYVGEIRVK